VHLDVCLESGELATERCVNVRSEIFTVENQPTTTCRLHPAKGLRLSNSSRKTKPAPEDTTSDRIHF
jgi:hypothetical protein